MLAQDQPKSNGMTTVSKDYGLNSAYIFWRALIEGFLWRALLEITFVEPFFSGVASSLAIILICTANSINLNFLLVLK